MWLHGKCPFMSSNIVAIFQVWRVLLCVCVCVCVCYVCVYIYIYIMCMYVWRSRTGNKVIFFHMFTYAYTSLCVYAYIIHFHADHLRTKHNTYTRQDVCKWICIVHVHVHDPQGEIIVCKHHDIQRCRHVCMYVHARGLLHILWGNSVQIHTHTRMCM
jgi:hypothetical protein